MKKIVMIMQIVVFVICLSGCAQYDKLIQERIEKQSGVEKSSEYAKYDELVSNQELGDDGLYQGEELKNLEDEHKKLSQGQVKVSLASNDFLKMKFYTDSSMEQEIETSYCYMNPGDSIYASQVDINNVASVSYNFLEYQIYEVDPKKEYKLLGSTDGSDGLVYTIPKDFEGSNISIVPVGEYQAKKLKFNTYYKDLAGKHDVVSSVWKINDEVYDRNAEIDSRDSYTVKCEYDASEYYFVNSIPSCFSNADGYVEFPRSDVQNDDSTYEVELHKYLSVKIKSDDKLEKAISLINVDNEKQSVSEKLTNLKVGQVVYLEVDSEYRVYSEDVQLSKPEKKGNKLAYKFEVKDTKSGAISIEVNKKYEITLADKESHGKCRFLLDGKTVSGTVYAKDGQKLEMQYTLTDKNYQIKEGLFAGLFGKETEYVKKIKIKDKLDGKEIVAEDYIEIVKKGEK